MSPAWGPCPPWPWTPRVTPGRSRLETAALTRLTDPRLSGLRARFAGLIEGFAPNPDDPAEVLELDRNVHLALRAFREALAQAGLNEKPLGPRTGVVFGTCSGGMLSIERHYEGLVAGEDRLDEALLFSKRYYTTAKILAWAAGAEGPVTSIVTACAAGSGAIAQAADLIRTGLADVVIAGGADSFSPSTLVGFDALKATATDMCAPFSLPVGLNLGEGAAFLVLERRDLAVRRGAEIRGELLGTGLSNDAYHPTAPDPSARGQLSAMGSALRDAGFGPERIDYVNAHGTGTRANDPAESRAVAKLIGERAAHVPLSSTKSMIGHCLGGAGALEASATLLGARAGVFPPTAGYTEKREGCDLDPVPDPGRPWKGRVALSNSFGFAGNNACLLLDTAPEEAPLAGPREELGRERPVITGLGLVTSAGLGAARLVDDGAAGLRAEDLGAPFGEISVGRVPEIDPREVDRRLDVKGMDRCSTFLALAARSAVGSAGIKPRPRNMEEIGLVVGIATGPGQGEAEHLTAVFESDFQLNRLGAFPYVVPNEVAGNVARTLMLKGHSTVLAGGQGAGLVSLISSSMAVKLGHADILLAGASDELTERSLKDGLALNLWGPNTQVIPGEGAAAMVVEDPEHAAARGAKPLGEILGHAMVTDGSSPRTADRSETLSRLLRALKADANLEEGAVSRIGVCSKGSGFDGADIVAAELGEQVEQLDLAPRLGLAEASTAAVNLAHLIETGTPGEIVISAWVSPEGLASAVAVKIL